MKIFLFAIFSLFPLLLLNRIESKGLHKHPTHAVTPPRGWNSYDSFCWTISEEEFLQNAELVSKRLRAHGYEYVVVDYLWYRRKVPGAYTDSSGFDVIDEWGRMVPDPDRWPSSKGGKGFTEVAKKVHSMGLKFGIHVMRGISTQAVNANTPILDTSKGAAYIEGGRKWTARDIGMTERKCVWMPHGFMSVNTKLGAGKAFLRSLYEQYAEWGVDFVKNDCVFGDDLDIEEISYVSEVLSKLSRPILYSLSPGTSVTPAMAKEISGLVNMYRITGDDWDTWGDVAAHFDVTRDFAAAKMIGSSGLSGKSWPDSDMLPLGWLTDPGSNEGPHRKCNLNINEQQTQITLWAMAKSPLMFGGDMRKLDDVTYNLITNPTFLEINAFSSNNQEFPFITGSHPSKSNPSFHSTQKKNIRNSHTSSLALVSCKEIKAKGWLVESVDQDLDQVCWKDNFETNEAAPFCIYKRKSQVTLGEELYATQYDGKSHLLETTDAAFCIDASPRQRLTSKEFRRGSSSPCKRDANQMWELNMNGTLANSYSGLCATVKTVEANAVPGGIRSWVATGRRGEIYLAVFNLNQGKTTITTDLSNIAKVLPGIKTGDVSKCREAWSSQDCHINRGSISMDVGAHGAALLVLTNNSASSNVVSFSFSSGYRVQING
ncbi:probable alpha-galactosidase B isoform X2 [Spinacia oleracea]|uniref:Alpha-galactosidase n=1 Tax=Spinacia oleracea TaxID=3562 RepID=A0A9R0ISX9_SPIOL|nr:probable alpha-galactosidase B isoform X2 [Spinacia oleracea]